MVFKLNDVTIPTDCTSRYNGTEIDRIQLNGVTVWEKNGTPVGGILFEQDTNGSATVTVKSTGTYELILVGAGSGAAAFTTSYYHKSSIASGGSGALIQDTVSLTSGQSLLITVGKAGTGDSGSMGSSTGSGTKSGYAGGQSTFQISGDSTTYKSAGGGAASSIQYASTLPSGSGISITPTAGSGGSTDPSGFTNGNSGTTNSFNTDGNTHTLSGGASVYSTYGAGGGATISGSDGTIFTLIPATDGYIKITRVA